jgi:NADP-reducing hydrogenase subunit HndB
MSRITSLDELSKLKVELVMEQNQEAHQGRTLLTVGMGSCGIAAGATDVFRALEEEIRTLGVKDVRLSPVGCIGLCKDEPIVEVMTGNASKVSYGRVDAAIARRIVREHIIDGKVIQDAVIDTTPFPTI